MVIQNNLLKPQRGRTISLATNPDVSATPLLNLAVKKMKDFNRDLKDEPFLLLYPDGTEVANIPGTQTPFSLSAYKAEVGKSYQRITLFLCSTRDFEEAGKLSDLSDSDPEMIIRQSSDFDLADTLPMEPIDESSPVQKVAETENGVGDIVLADEVQQVMDVDNLVSGLPGNNPGTSQCPTFQSSCYRDYTDLFEPIIIEDDDEIEHFTEDKNHDLPPAEYVEKDVQPHDIIAELAMDIDHKKVSRFNICRSDVWDGAVRGFQRSTYSDNNDMFIKFNDDAGFLEEGLDTGGPRREFLTLLMAVLRNRPIFDGPTESRYIVCNSRAAREDEYFLAGKMIAVSIVHGGPAPHFLSKNLVNYLIGNPSFSATIEDVKDEEIGKVLKEVLEAESDESLLNVILQNSGMFQTAGCFRGVKASEKKAFIEEYLRWYILDRNHSAIQRFKDGLGSLGFFAALQKHPSVLSPVLCFSAKALTASDLETMFKPVLSPVGSNRQQKEGKTIVFWADYLLDCEEKTTAVSLEEVLMFSTGLTAIPPAGMMPSPHLEFLSDSPFPLANTCANTLKLPLLDSYTAFRANMDFGIQNAPGFGCY
ncbi:G2/M phase-specific E3 ubiquitin-protein ligase-like [Poecilia formosa]|uniref:G2/M phase-specific E3 ubiquitin-protein ligase-like n=1 Tax=Poecilia formosa TaxID=48698 RepID=UPI0007B938E5|nr:PREDICTED: G2/M phase-specific E3 ubiquitin-protein ligase-like [Poecilia formosa]